MLKLIWRPLLTGFRRGMCKAGVHKIRGAQPFRVCLWCKRTERELVAAQTTRSDVVRPVGDGDSLRSSPPRANKMLRNEERVEAQISPELSAQIDRRGNEETKA